MDTNTIELHTSDGPMAVYEVIPRTTKDAIIVVQEAFGVNDHIQDVTRRLAGQGFHSVAPAFFHRAGGGTAPYDDFAQVLPLYEGLDDDAILTDLDAAFDHLNNAGFADDQIGLVGFCFGGRVSFLAALERRFGAAVGFYGGGIVTGRFPQFPTLIDRANDLKTPWLGIFGDLDTSIPVTDVETLRTTLDDLAIDTEVHRFADADHGFHCDVRASYHAMSAATAWAQTMQWLDRNLRH
jgi:carboxymethylenebutenolidase